MTLLQAAPVLLLPEQCYTSHCEYVREWFQEAYMMRRKESAWVRAQERRRIISGPPIPLLPPDQVLELSFADRKRLVDRAFEYIYHRHPRLKKPASVFIQLTTARDGFSIQFGKNFMTTSEFERLAFYRVADADRFFDMMVPRRNAGPVQEPVQLELFPQL